MLSYQIYSDSKIAVVGDKDEYHFFLKEIGGRWNPRMKGGAGWLVPIENLDKLQKLIITLKKKSKDLESINNNFKPKSKKYRRENSDREDSSDDSSVDSDIAKMLEQAKQEEADEEEADEEEDNEEADEEEDHCIEELLLAVSPNVNPVKRTHSKTKD